MWFSIMIQTYYMRKSLWNILLLSFVILLIIQLAFQCDEFCYIILSHGSQKVKVELIRKYYVCHEVFPTISPGDEFQIHVLHLAY